MLFYMCNIMGTDHHLVCYLSHYISYSTEKIYPHATNVSWSQQGIYYVASLSKMVLKRSMDER